MEKDGKKMWFNYRLKLIMQTLKEAIKDEISKKGEFFGIKVNKKES